MWDLGLTYVLWTLRCANLPPPVTLETRMKQSDTWPDSHKLSMTWPTGSGIASRNMVKDYTFLCSFSYFHLLQSCRYVGCSRWIRNISGERSRNNQVFMHFLTGVKWLNSNSNWTCITANRLIDLCCAFSIDWQLLTLWL